MADEESGGYYFDGAGGNDDVYIETSHQSWLSRLGDSWKGLCVGPLLGIIAVVLLFWNEGRAVHRYKDLEESAGLVQSISDPTYLDYDLDGKLIHASGKVQADAYLEDDVFGIQQDAIKMRRKVETYQWVEEVETSTKKNNGGSTTTTKNYRYHKEWRDELINSYNFKESTYHQNPDEKLFEDQSWRANEVTLGAYTLSNSIVSSMDWWTQLSDLSDYENNIPEADNGYYGQLYGKGKIYYGENPSSPAVGDTRVTFSIVPTGKISIVAEQSGQTFVPYYTSRGGQVMLVEQGIVGAQEMIAHAEMENVMTTWLIRVVGFFLLFIAFNACLQPLSTFADILPIIGDFLSEGVIPCLGFLVSASVSTVVIAVAWLFYRPVVGICMLVVVGVVALLVVQLVNRKQQQHSMMGSNNPGSYPYRPNYPAPNQQQQQQQQQQQPFGVYPNQPVVHSQGQQQFQQQQQVPVVMAQPTYPQPSAPIGEEGDIVVPGQLVQPIMATAVPVGAAQLPSQPQQEQQQKGSIPFSMAIGPH